MNTTAGTHFRLADVLRSLPIIAVLVSIIFVSSQQFADLLRLNQLSTATARWFHDQDLSLTELGLLLDYGERFPHDQLAPYAAAADCDTDSRLSLRRGIVQMLEGNFEAAARCFSANLTASPEALDTLILAVAAYHAAGQDSAARAAFEKLPPGTQGSAMISALAIFDYLPAATASARGNVDHKQLGNIFPRRVLFDLLSYKPDIARAFLERMADAGVYSAEDRTDFESLQNWQTLGAAGGMLSKPILRTDTELERSDQDLRRSMATSLGCPEGSLEVGPNLLPEGLFDQPNSLDLWRNLSWTTSGGSYNLGKFVSGNDRPDGMTGPSALRISGLWKYEDSNRYPASGSLELKRSVEVPAGRNAYVMSVRYKTENMQSDHAELWFDSADYRSLVGVWQLPPSAYVWQELYALGYFDGDKATAIHPLISQKALGTIWIDRLQIRPVRLAQCDFGDRMFGSVVAQGG